MTTINEPWHLRTDISGQLLVCLFFFIVCSSRAGWITLFRIAGMGTIDYWKSFGYFYRSDRDLVPILPSGASEAYPEMGWRMCVELINQLCSTSMGGK